MKKHLISASIAMLAALMLVTVSAADEAEKGPYKSFEEKFGYAIGMDIGTNLKDNSIEIDLDALLKGLTDGFKGNESALTDEEIEAIKTEAMTKLRAQAQAQRIKAAADNLTKAEEFLAENKGKKGVQSTDTGLQYEVIKEGTGAMPKATDQVKVHYTGTLLDGTVFDSSYKRNAPATFQVNRLIKGWTEALQLMKVGDKWKLYVPPALAYGEQGAGQSIGPNELLVFEMELLEIVPPANPDEKKE